MDLRPYQSDAIDRARAARRAGHRRILIVAPTGSGKTVIGVAIALLAMAQGARVLWIAHRKELVDQAWGAFYRRGVVPGVLRGQDERTDPAALVQVGTIQTLARRDLPPADFVFVDEAHRCPGDSYARVLAGYPAATVFGLTATPARLDGEPLRAHFDAMGGVAPYSTLIDGGAILAPVVYAARQAPKTERLHRTGGDYRLDELEAAVREPHVVGDVVDRWLELSGVGPGGEKLAGRRKTVLFAVGIAHSRELVELLRAERVRAAHLDGTTPEGEREQILLDLELGKLELVSNVGVLCEGWDQPSVKCCVMARPTLSLTLWMQCAGRILRPWCGLCGVPRCEEHPQVAPLVLDHSGNVGRHGLPHEDRNWTLDGPGRKPPGDAIRLCPKCNGYVKKSPCELCGFAAPVARRAIRTSDGVLERVDAAIAAERSKDPKRAEFDKLADEARRKGFKPGYASAKWKEKHGDKWPPWEWSQALKAEFAKDADWQEREAKRSRERAFWKEQNEAKAREIEAQPEVADTGDGGAFDGLL